MARIRKPKISNGELRERAREQLRKDPDGYWDFLGEIREEVTETQMTMLIDYQDEFRVRYKAPYTNG